MESGRIYDAPVISASPPTLSRFSFYLVSSFAVLCAFPLTDCSSDGSSFGSVPIPFSLPLFSFFLFVFLNINL